MLKLFRTEEINQNNMLDALKGLNDVISTDHQSIQTLQKEQAERNEKLLREIKGVKGEVTSLKGEVKGVKNEVKGVKGEVKGLKDTVKSLENKVDEGFKENNQRLQSLENTQSQMVDLLRMIADNTKK